MIKENDGFYNREPMRFRVKNVSIHGKENQTYQFRTKQKAEFFLKEYCEGQKLKIESLVIKEEGGDVIEAEVKNVTPTTAKKLI